MKLDEFDFDLPEERIALHPARPRDSARMLIVQPWRDEPIFDSKVLQLPSFLRPGDALVVNNTRVIPAQLSAVRERQTDQGKIEASVDLTLHLRTGDDSWDAFARPAKKLEAGDLLIFSEDLSARVGGKRQGGEVSLHFSKTGPVLDEAIKSIGEMPLPPYIALRRGYLSSDRDDYQTIYAKREGAVAAPTAGLHTTDQLLDAVRAQGVNVHTVTLHVGAGTFQPVKTDTIEEHKMHSEVGEIDPETALALNEVRRNGGRIVAVGTTTLRLLESAVSGSGEIMPFKSATDIFITPGYRFTAVDILMTNFHLPRSTLFMLVSAFSGLSLMKQAYQHAIQSEYRFYSYGDASLLWRANLPEALR
ncbi:MAG: tRNA preQ1(34) S-adenosylmethionine ribosyltransferase-isomerase QueA [Pseudomonadota bacterium]